MRACDVRLAAAPSVLPDTCGLFVSNEEYYRTYGTLVPYVTEPVDYVSLVVICLSMCITDTVTV